VEGGTAARWVRPLRGESGTTAQPAPLSSWGLSSCCWLCGECVGTLGEVLDGGDELSAGCEVACWLVERLGGAGPGVLTVLDWLSSHTEL